MPNFDHIAFGVQATKIKQDADRLSRNVHLALVYAQDTARTAGQADFDLLHAAACLELAARDCRLLHARVEQLRADQKKPVLIAAE